MKKEVLQFQSLKVKRNQRISLKSLYFQLIKGEMNEVVFCTNSDKNAFLELFRGRGELLAGRVFINGRKISQHEFKRLMVRETAIIMKQSSLYHSLSLLDNIFVSCKNTDLFNESKVRRINQVLRELGIELRLNQSVKEVSESERLIIECLRAYVENKKIIVINSILAEMMQGEFDFFIEIIQKLTAKGMSFVVTEMIQNPIVTTSDNLYCVKDGRTLGYFPQGTADLKKVKNMLLKKSSSEGAREVSKPSLTKLLLHEDKVSLVFDRVCAGDMEKLTFEAYQGELLTLFFLQYEGLQKFIGILTGRNCLVAGQMTVDGKECCIKDEKSMVDHGIAIINNLNEKGNFYENLSVLDNILLARANKSPNVFIKRKLYNNVIRTINQIMGVGVADKKAAMLSNEMKIKLEYVIWLVYRPKVVFVVNPLFEKDISLHGTVYQMIQLLKQNNITVIVLLSSFSNIDKFEGETIYISKGIQLEEEEIYMEILDL
ncbi:ABC-type sugar transport system ATPase subunit [Lachnospiraceae bacterium PF1-22]|uniref:hypothetical protein n=1 Tax=Ohessyouella blattaphilus TaxID=2949333 RepID=UPI003E1C46B9